MKLGTNCPRCGEPLNQERPALNALSRVDNETYICSACGTMEGLWNYSHPGEPLPPLDVDLGKEELHVTMTKNPDGTFNLVDMHPLDDFEDGAQHRSRS
jgi:hypothetical protein